MFCGSEKRKGGGGGGGGEAVNLDINKILCNKLFLMKKLDCALVN